jgi:16S rRNA G966 N2-methylase RsmD
MDSHPAAKLLPLMDAAELQALAADIKTNGLIYPVVTYQGTVLDGRNRLAACELAGVAPHFEEYAGQDPIGYVWSVNGPRRHLTPSQRAMVATEMATLRDGQRADYATGAQNCAPVKSQAAAAAEVGVSRRTLQQAAAIKRADPELAAKVLAGEATLQQADRILRHTDAKARFKAQIEAAPAEQRPTIALADALDWLREQAPADLLLTDPPYSTDVADIAAFADWLSIAWAKIKPSGRGYVFIGAYPAEILAYLAVCKAHDLPLRQVLVWTYRNTMGPSPRDAYKLNWQAILYLVGPDAAALDCPMLIEQFSVQDINASDGRLGDRVHAWQKPMDIAERFIRHATRPGDTILDPFAGTGTFLLAATKLGRTARGCDTSPEMIALARSRGCINE